jgi:hypothetical protein
LQEIEELEIAASYVDKLDECLADWDDSGNISVSERWESFKNIITTADSVLGNADKMKYEDRFDVKCGLVTTFKNTAYERMQHRNHTQNAERSIV